MALLDENFDAEEQHIKHKDIYEDAYENYLAYIKERIEANDIEVRKNQYQALLKDFHEFKNEFANVTGKSMAGKEMKNKVPKDSNLYKDFEDNEKMFADMDAKNSRLCDELKLLDDNFDEEKHITKKHRDIYTTSYDTYMTYIKMKIEAEDKELFELRYQTLLKDLDKLLIESNTVRANFNAIEKMRNQIPNESPILKGFDTLQCNYTNYQEKINQVCQQLDSIDKQFNRENYRNKKPILLMKINMISS